MIRFLTIYIFSVIFFGGFSSAEAQNEWLLEYEHYKGIVGTESDDNDEWNGELDFYFKGDNDLFDVGLIDGGIFSRVAWSSPWGEIHFGPYINPIPRFDGLSLGIGGGVEFYRHLNINDAERDMMELLWTIFSKLDISLFEIYYSYEHGGITGPWHRYYTIYELNDRIKVGGIYKTYIGMGPLLEVAFGKIFHFRISPVWNVKRDSSGFEVTVGASRKCWGVGRCN